MILSCFNRVEKIANREVASDLNSTALNKTPFSLKSHIDKYRRRYMSSSRGQWS